MRRFFFFTTLLVLGMCSSVSAQNYTWPLTTDFTGKVDISKYTTEQVQNITIELFTAKKPFKDSSDPTYKPEIDDPAKNTELIRTFFAHTAKTDSPIGIAADGTYYFIGVTNDLTPGQTYYYAQQFIVGDTSEVKGLCNGGVCSFTTSGTLTVAERVEQQEDHSYRLLAPWPGFSLLLDPKICLEKLAEKGNTIEAQQELHCSPEDPSGFNYMLNYIFKLLIGVAAVVLVLRLMYEGYVYVVTDVPFLKMSAKSGIFTAFFGLVLALSAYLILNTINPKLVSNSLSLENVTIDVVNYPDAGDDTVDPEFKSGKARYSKDASLSAAIPVVINKIKNEGWEIDSFKVYPNDRMAIIIKKGSVFDPNNIIDVSHGKGGFAPAGQARQGDKKTPMGVWKIIDIREPKTPGQPIFNANGSNMGAAFFHLSPMINGERGIGMHGNKTGTLSPTIGCIRLKNADIEALLPYIKVGTKVVIGN